MRDSGLWYWGYYPYWNWQEPAPTDAPVYFLFVEDAETLPPAEMVDGPDASDFRPDHPVLKEGSVRFRTSGILAADFAVWMDRFEELTSSTVGPEQRRARRETLRGFFEAVRLPVVDIYVGRSDDELQALHLTLSAGSWHLAYIRYGAKEQHSRPVYASDGAMIEAEGVRSGGLAHLAPVPPPLELRLRDIFSLNHVPDGEVDPDESDDSAPFDAPRPGFRPSGGGGAEALEEVADGELWRVIEDGTEEEKEEEAPAVRHTYSRKGYDPAPAKRKLFRSQGGNS
jgi:hypothetical protein